MTRYAQLLKTGYDSPTPIVIALRKVIKTGKQPVTTVVGKMEFITVLKETGRYYHIIHAIIMCYRRTIMKYYHVSVHDHYVLIL